MVESVYGRVAALFGASCEKAPQHWIRGTRAAERTTHRVPLKDRPRRRPMGLYVFSAAAIATGIMDLAYRAFDPAEQPIQAWGDSVPGSHPFACVVGTALVVGGLTIIARRTRHFGAAVLAGVYAIFAAFWLPRLITAPEILGHFPGVYVGILSGIASQVVVVCALLVVDGYPTPRLFGTCVVLFGLQHLFNIHSPNNTAMVPLWMPFGQVFWVAFTGVAFVAAAIAIATGIAGALAGRLLAAMLLVFSAVTLIPLLVAAPGSEADWGANLYNIAVAGCALIVADWYGSKNLTVA